MTRPLLAWLPLLAIVVGCKAIEVEPTAKVDWRLIGSTDPIGRGTELLATTHGFLPEMGKAESRLTFSIYQTFLCNCVPRILIARGIATVQRGWVVPVNFTAEVRFVMEATASLQRTTQIPDSGPPARFLNSTYTVTESCANCTTKVYKILGEPNPSARISSLSQAATSGRNLTVSQGMEFFAMARSVPSIPPSEVAGVMGGLLGLTAYRTRLVLLSLVRYFRAEGSPGASLKRGFGINMLPFVVEMVNRMFLVVKVEDLPLQLVVEQIAGVKLILEMFTFLSPFTALPSANNSTGSKFATQAVVRAGLEEMLVVAARVYMRIYRPVTQSDTQEELKVETGGCGLRFILDMAVGQDRGRVERKHCLHFTPRLSENPVMPAVTMYGAYVFTEAGGCKMDLDGTGGQLPALGILVMNRTDQPTNSTLLTQSTILDSSTLSFDLSGLGNGPCSALNQAGSFNQTVFQHAGVPELGGQEQCLLRRVANPDAVITWVARSTSPLVPDPDFPPIPATNPLVSSLPGAPIVSPIHESYGSDDDDSNSRLMGAIIGAGGLLICLIICCYIFRFRAYKAEKAEEERNAPPAMPRTGSGSSDIYSAASQSDLRVDSDLIDNGMTTYVMPDTGLDPTPARPPSPSDDEVSNEKQLESTKEGEPKVQMVNGQYKPPV